MLSAVKSLPSRVVIGRRDQGTSTRILKGQYLATFKWNRKKFTFNVVFCPPTLILQGWKLKFDRLAIGQVPINAKKVWDLYPPK